MAPGSVGDEWTPPAPIPRASIRGSIASSEVGHRIDDGHQ